MSFGIGNTNSQYSFFYETRDHLGNIISVWDAGHGWLNWFVSVRTDLLLSFIDHGKTD